MVEWLSEASNKAKSDAIVLSASLIASQDASMTSVPLRDTCAMNRLLLRAQPAVLVFLVDMIQRVNATVVKGAGNELQQGLHMSQPLWSYADLIICTAVIGDCLC